MEKQRPRLGCATVVRKDDSIVLIKRGKEPNYGKWVIPGGGVELFEPVRLAAKREILEETGLVVKIRDFIGPYEIISKQTDEHRVILYWWGDYISGELRASSDALKAGYFKKDEVKSMVRSKSTSEIVTKVLKGISWG